MTHVLTRFKSGNYYVAPRLPLGTSEKEVLQHSLVAFEPVEGETYKVIKDRLTGKIGYTVNMLDYIDFVSVVESPLKYD